MKRVLLMTLTAAMVLSVPSVASAGDDEVRREGPCSGSSDWEMRVRDEGSTLRVRWRVDSGVPGQTWRMTLARNGQQIAAANRLTNADGEATIDRRGLPDQQGPDQFTGTARNLASGETCSGQATL
jgi:hypothetical protein